MAKRHYEGPGPLPKITRESVYTPPSTPAEEVKKGYEPKQTSATVYAGKTIMKNVCLYKVFSPSAPSPPPPRAVPPPPPKVGTAQISGHVKDSITGETLGDVLVSLNGEQERTEKNGRYSFRDVKPGTYRLSAEKEGYKEFVWSIRLVSKQDVKKDISLVSLPLVPNINAMNRITGWASKIHSSKFDYNTMVELPFDYIYPKGEWKWIMGIPGVTHVYYPDKWAVSSLGNMEEILAHAQQLADSFGGPKEAYYRIRV